MTMMTDKSCPLWRGFLISGDVTMNNQKSGVLADILFDVMESLTAGDSTPKEANAITKQINAFYRLLKNGDKQAREFHVRINSGDIPREDVLVQLHEFLRNKH